MQSPRRAQGLSYVTIKAKVILALFYQKIYALQVAKMHLITPKMD